MYYDLTPLIILFCFCLGTGIFFYHAFTFDYDPIATKASKKTQRSFRYLTKLLNSKKNNIFIVNKLQKKLNCSRTLSYEIYYYFIIKDYETVKLILFNYFNKR